MYLATALFVVLKQNVPSITYPVVKQRNIQARHVLGHGKLQNQQFHGHDALLIQGLDPQFADPSEGYPVSVYFRFWHWRSEVCSQKIKITTLVRLFDMF